MNFQTHNIQNHPFQQKELQEIIQNVKEKNNKKFNGELSAFSILYDFLKKDWKLITIYIIVTLLSYPMESIILPQMYSYFFETIKTDQRKETFIKYFVILTAILTVTYSSASLQHYYESLILPKIHSHYVNFIFKNILRKYQNEYTDLDLGAIIGKITAIPTIMREITSDIAAWIMPRVIAIFVINIYFFYIHWKLGLISLILIVIFIIINMNLFDKCINIATSRQLQQDSKNSEINDKLSNLYSIYSAGDIALEIEKYESNTLKVQKKSTSAIQCVNRNKIINIIFIILLFIILNGYITFLFKNKELSYHTLVALFITIIYYVPCFYNISESIPDITHYLGVLNNYNDFLGELEKTQHSTNVDKRPDIEISSGKIDIKNLNFDYNGTRPLFHNLNLQINSGDHVAFIGQSGNGKSTLIKLIMGYYHVDDNTVFIDGQDINKYNLESLRKQICFVNQNSKLFNMSIYDNIAYGNQLSHNDIDKLISNIGIGRIFDGLKNGLNTSAGVNGDQLSGGQKQMIHILRAIGKKNKIIVMDEPTAAIDVANRDLVIKAIVQMSKNKTLLLITHDDTLLKTCNRVIRIANGVIVSDKKY